MKNLIPLNLPEAPLKLAKKEGAIFCWDDIRKKYLKLTPEEWVRQHFVFFLLEKGYPKSAFALEGGFHLHQKLQRTDILIYKNRQPKLLVECKAPQVPLSQKTFDQAARYNLNYEVDFLIVTNGLEHFYAKVDRENERYVFMEDVPLFSEI